MAFSITDLENLFKSRWPYFRPYEVLSPDHIKAFEEKGVIMVQEHAMDFLCKYREWIQFPLLINQGMLKYRGTRSYVENITAGGKEDSQHLLGIAFDISCPHLLLDDLEHRALSFGWHGVGKYPSKDFVHHDLRTLLYGKPTTWIGT